MKRLSSIALVALLLAPWAGLHAAEVTNLRCEYLKDPLGIDVVKPRLSWKTEVGGQRSEVSGLKQAAYQVLVATSEELLAEGKADLWDSGKVAGDQSIHVEYAGKLLASRMRCHWKVRVWVLTSDLRPPTSSPWSQPAFWSMGLLKPDDWQAKWIGLDRDPKAKPVLLESAQWIWFPADAPASGAPAGTCCFRRAFILPDDRRITKATIQMTADNAFALAVNGKQAGQGDDWNMPVTLDLAGSLQAGTNILAVVATNAGDGPSPAGLIGVLSVEFDKGEPMVIGTDAQWKCRRETAEGWEAAGFNDAQWQVAQGLGAYGMGPWGQLSGLPMGQVGSQYHPWLRRTFVVPAGVKRADIYVNTPGNYELYVNGQKVGEDLLAPAYSDFRKRMFYTVHDIAGLLREGTNCVALWLGPGWYQPGANPYRSSIVRAQLELEAATGRQILVTDGTWRGVPSCISQVGTWSWNAMGGEMWDAANYIADWNLAGFDDQGWLPALEVAAPPAATTWLAMPGSRAGKPVPPARIYPVNNKWVIDFGTTLTGWMRLKLAGLKPGQQVTIDYADLDKPELQHMPGPDGFQTFNQRDIYVAGGRADDVFCSKFNQHAFRYAVIAGLSRAPTANEAEAFTVMTALDPAGTFECSNPLFNRIHQITVATCRSQTPCGVLGGGESREKEGYGDGGAFLTGFLYNFRSDAFFRKWLTDFRDGQNEEGFIPHTAPWHAYHGGGPPWGGQASELTRRLHLYYGDRRAIAEAYPALRRYVDYIEAHTKNDVLRYYCPYGDGHGWFLGDWQAPPASEETQGFNEETDDEKAFFNNGYRILLWDHLAGFAGALGDQAEAKRCQERLAVIRPRVHKTWFDQEKKRYRCSRQAYLAMALQARIMPPELRPAILKQLEDEIVVAKKGHLDAGLLGSSLLLDLLTKENRGDLVALMMGQTTYPGWGFLVEKRKVTTWPETWTGWGSQIIQVVGTPGAWFYEGLAGIRPDPAAPGFNHFIIRPGIVDSVEWVRCGYDSPYGRIVSNWKREGDSLTMEVTIPPNTTATVHVPATDAAAVTESDKPAAKAKGVKFLRMEDGAAVYEVGSGMYVFQSTLTETIR